MTDRKIETSNWEVLPRIRLYGQPVGLGIPLTFAGGALSLNMLQAFKSEEHWILQLATIAMILGFGAIFLVGLRFLLQPLQKLWVSREEVQLRLGPIVLRRIAAADIRSVGATSREVTVQDRECDLYRVLLYCNGKWPQNRTLWLDWSLETEEVLRRKLPKANFLM